MDNIDLTKLTNAQLKNLEKTFRQERTRRKTKRVAHDMCGRDRCLEILGKVEKVPQTAEEIARLTEYTEKEVRWVMRTYSVAHTDETPRRYYLVTDKVARTS